MNSNAVDLMVSYGAASLLALLFHGAVVGLLMVNWADGVRDFTDIQPYYIEAAVVAGNPLVSKAERERLRKQAVADRRARQLEATDAKMNADQADWEREKEKLEEAHQRAAQELAEKETLLAEQDGEGRSAEDEERLRAALRQNIALAIAQEEGSRKAVTDDEKAMAYVAQIQREIIANWSRPPSARNGMRAILRVRLIPTGEVVDVKVEESSGNDAFDRSAVVAVRKAEKFIVPEDSRRFERNFREFTVLFRPEDLRL